MSCTCGQCTGTAEPREAAVIAHCERCGDELDEGQSAYEIDGDYLCGPTCTIEYFIDVLGGRKIVMGE